MLPQITDFITHKIDFLCFICFAILLSFVVYRFVLRRVGISASGTWFRLGLLAFALLSWWMVEHAETLEMSKLESIMETTPPTYAAEMQRMGHSKITLETPANDENYLKMIEAEKRWLRVNTAINDVYTVRRAKNGKSQLIVDSETDYNHNGEFDGEREVRTNIGEEFDWDAQIMPLAYGGKAGFSKAPTTDRWGTWVTGYAPIKNEDGTVDAILGVDVDATIWQRAAARARLTMLGWLGGAFVLANIALVVAGARLLARENERQRETTEEISQSRSRLESIINSIDGIVWEWDLAAERFIFASKKTQEVLGLESSALENDPSLWRSRVHPEDLPLLERQRRLSENSGKPYSVDYRFAKPTGEALWLRERGVPVKCSDKKTSCLRAITADITAGKQYEAELETLNRQLVLTSRQAGMAEVASGVIHNVGNVLNSVNVSTSVITEIISESKVQVLEKIAQLLQTQEGHLTEFFTNDPRGRALPKFLLELSKQMRTEQTAVLKEMGGLAHNVTHIKQIVMMQQSFARTGGSTEPLKAVDMIEDSIRINEASLIRHEIQLRRDFADVPTVLADRNKVMQILINLIRNAKHALSESTQKEPRITITLESTSSDTVCIAVADNGKGMSKETMASLFSYGFTTRKHGHGFGLHSGAAAASEMGGSLTACSEGVNCGASFRLTLPAMSSISSTAPMDELPAEPLPVLPSLDSPTLRATSPLAPASLRNTAKISELQHA